MAIWHYYNADGEKVGPMTGRQLKKLALDGIIVPGTAVETEDGRTGLAKDIEGLKFAESALKLQPMLRPPNSVGIAPPDTGDVYDLALPQPPPEPPTKPNPPVTGDSFVAFISEVSQTVPGSSVENSAASSPQWTASRWDWEVLLNRSFLSVLALLFLIGAVVFAGLRWYIPHSQPPQQTADKKVEQQKQQNVGAKAEQVKPSPFKDIFDAAEKGTVQDIEYFVKNGVSVQTRNHDHNELTPLHFAAWQNTDVEVVKYLVSQGADVNAKNGHGWTPLHEAAARNSNLEVLRYLVSVRGVDINAKSELIFTGGEMVRAEPGKGETPFDVAERDGNNLTEAKRAILRAAMTGRTITPQRRHTASVTTANQLTEEMKRDGWVAIFDGKTLTGWKSNEQYEGFRVQDGCIVGFGERNHLYFMEELENFELKIDAKINRGGNSGVYVKAQWQDAEFPLTGFELQINNSSQIEPQKTGSLYGIVKIDKAPHGDNEWFTYHIICKGNTLECRINGNTLYIHDDKEKSTLPRVTKITEQNKRISQRGYIALQQHDPGTVVEFKNVFIKKLSN